MYVMYITYNMASGGARAVLARPGGQQRRPEWRWGGNNGAETMGGSRCMSTGYAGYSKCLIERISLLYWPPLPSLQLWSPGVRLSLIHISEPTRRTPISYAVFCLKKK